MLSTDVVVGAIRRELRQVVDVPVGPEAKQAAKRVARAEAKQLRTAKAAASDEHGRTPAAEREAGAEA